MAGLLENYCKICGYYNQMLDGICQSCGAILDPSDYLANSSVVEDYYNQNYNITTNNTTGGYNNGNYTIQRHSFETAKYNIWKFAKSVPSDVELSRFETDGGFLWLGDHRVTGREMNNYTQKLQELLIALNGRDKDIINQFREIYNAFDALDKDYISGILASVKAAEGAAEEAKQAGLNAQKALNEIDKTVKDLAATQGNLTANTAALEKTIVALSKFKTKLDQIQHLDDVDDIWEGFRKTQKNVKDLSEDTSKVISIVKNNAQDIKLLSKFKEKLDKINHIKDIDKLWEDLQDAKKSMPIIEKQIENIENTLRDCANNLSNLNELKIKIDNIKHINDVDILWDNFQKAALVITSIKDDVNNIESKLENCSVSVALLLELKSKIDEINHLDDLDKLWDDVLELQQDMKFEKHYTEEIKDELNYHKQSIQKAIDFIEEFEQYEHLMDIDIVWDKCNLFENDIKKTKEDIFRQQEKFESLQVSVAELQNNIDKNSKSISKKLTLAYVLTGTSIFISLIEFILLVLR